MCPFLNHRDMSPTPQQLGPSAVNSPNMNVVAQPHPLHHTKVALVCGVPRNLDALLDVFPIDRETWLDGADFRDSLAKWLKVTKGVLGDPGMML